MSSTPMFAVVGHPNKGKSSIVATLAGDDSVRIGADPGTTTRCRHFPMKVDGAVLYTLVDTPGFQRARRALAWMEERETTAARHPDVVETFVESYRATDTFPDECELLSPIVDGAGILYVVDGSVPYGPEYEAEMKILRWTGRPRMGLINPIGPANHIEEWRVALGQYFSVVRVFNALHSGFHKRIELLQAFGELQEDWRPILRRAVDSLRADHARRRRRVAAVLAETLSRMLTHSTETRLRKDSDIEHERPRLIEAYHRDLQRLEARSRTQVEELYDHYRIDREEPALEALRTDELFSERTWSVFGLSKKQLLGLGAVGGGAAGGMIDLAAGGTSFLLGALVGSAVGAASTFWGGRTLAETKIKNIPLGGTKLVVLPSRNVNFPHVVFARARLHHALIAGRTHAERGSMVLTGKLSEVASPLSDSRRRDLEKVFSRIRRSVGAESAGERLTEMIESILAEDDSARSSE